MRGSGSGRGLSSSFVVHVRRSGASSSLAPRGLTVPVERHGRGRPSATAGSRPVAIITARQLAVFREYLRAEGLRAGIVMMHPDRADDDYLSYHLTR